jgi:predicted phosphodiesterase
VKILCVADEKDLLVYSENIGKRYGDVDLVISAGDLPLRYYEFIVSSLNKNLYFVFGNHHAQQLPRYRKMGFWDDPFTVRFDEGHGGIFIDGKVKRDKPSNLIKARLAETMLPQQTLKNAQAKNLFLQKIAFEEIKIVSLGE